MMHHFKNIFWLTILLSMIPLILTGQSSRQEKVYVHTDRSFYIAGEDVFYKLYLIHQENNKLSDYSKVSYLTLRSSRSQTVLKLRLTVEKGVAYGSFVLPDTLSSGVYQLCAFSNWMKNFDENLFYHKELIVVNRFDQNPDSISMNTQNTFNFNDTTAIIYTDKKNYSTREKVQVKWNQQLPKGQYSVAVYEMPEPMPISGSIVEVLNNKNLQFSTSSNSNKYYTPEVKGRTLTGFVLHRENNQPQSNVVVLLSVPDTVPNLQYAVTQNDGSFRMLLSDYYDGKELFLTIKDAKSKSNYKIITDDPYLFQQKWNPSRKGTVNPDKDFILKSQQLVYIQKIFNLNKPAENRNKKEPLYIPRFFNRKAISVWPADFTSLPDFFEITVELLPKVRIQKKNDEYYFQVTNDLIREFDNQSPAVFLDGVFVDDIDKILGLNSDRILRIDVIDYQRAFGDFIFGGMISIITKGNEIIKTKPANHSLRLKNDKPQKGKSFQTLYLSEIPDKNFPFLRQVLYWNPMMNDSFEFYTSDHQGKFILQLEGITDEGVPVSLSSIFKVENIIKESVK